MAGSLTPFSPVDVCCKCGRLAEHGTAKRLQFVGFETLEKAETEATCAECCQGECSGQCSCCKERVNGCVLEESKRLVESLHAVGYYREMEHA